MKKNNSFAALLVSALSSVACSGQTTGNGPESIAKVSSTLTIPNQICAAWSPYHENVNWYCEVTHDVGHVYQTARQKADNQAPTVTLWVLWPIDEGQENDPGKISGWFDEVNHVLAWLKGQSDLALFDRSIKAMQHGHARLLASQQRLINSKKGAIADAVKAVQGKVNAQASDPQKAALAVALADAKIKLEGLGQVLGMAREALNALGPTYQQLVSDFQAYRATESQVLAKIDGFSADASRADLTKLAQLTAAVGDYQRATASVGGELPSRARDLQSRLVAVQGQYEAGLKPYADFAQSRGLKDPMLADAALRAVGNMMIYCEARQAGVDAAFAKLNDGIRARSDALVELSVDKATRDSLAQARFTQVATGFLNDANTRIAALWAAPSTSPTLRYPFYSSQYDKFTSFAQLEAMCSQAALAASSYMKSGCNALKPSFDRARAWFTDTLPGALRMRLILLRRKNADENLCKQVEAALAVGNLKAAVAAYDSALSLLDPGGQP